MKKGILSQHCNSMYIVAATCFLLVGCTAPVSDEKLEDSVTVFLNPDYLAQIVLDIPSRIIHHGDVVDSLTTCDEFQLCIKAPFVLVDPVLAGAENVEIIYSSTVPNYHIQTSIFNEYCGRMMVDEKGYIRAIAACDDDSPRQPSRGDLWFIHVDGKPLSVSVVSHQNE